jgi:Arc/MetJ family transcription regulator
MRMCIEIDEELLREVMRIGGFRTKKAAVDAALRLWLRVHTRERIRTLRGKQTTPR